MTETIKARYVYEFDLKGFFDNVPVKNVINWLASLSGKEAISRDPRTEPIHGYLDDRPEIAPPKRKPGLPRHRLVNPPARREAVWKQFRLDAGRVLRGLWET